MFRSNPSSLRLILTVSRVHNNYATLLHRIHKQLFSAQAMLQRKESHRTPEISINFLSQSSTLQDREQPSIDIHSHPYLQNNDKLKSYLKDNELRFDEVSDIVLKYGVSYNRETEPIIYKEIENYLSIKREIHTFPLELQEKILQYARDTSHIGVRVDKIRQQIKNELLSIQQARSDIDDLVQTMDKINRNAATSDVYTKKSKKLEIILSQFIHAVESELQKQSDLMIENKTKRNKGKLASKILAIMDCRRSAEIGIRCLIDQLHNMHRDKDKHGSDDDISDAAPTNRTGVPYAHICSAIGKEIERELFLVNKLSSAETQRFLEHELKDCNPPNKTSLHLASNLGIKIGDSFNERNLFEIGALILDSILNSCFVGKNHAPAFIHHMNITKNMKCIGYIVCDDYFYDGVLCKELRYKPPKEIHPVAQPMVIPPRPWKNIDEGPFFYYNESLMRYLDYKNQYKPLRGSEDLNELLQCVNILQSTAWNINPKVLSVMRYLYDEEDGNIAGLPNRLDHPLPHVSQFDGDKHNKQYQYKLKAIKKLNAEQHSLRCDLQLKMDLAKQLETEEAVYFPLNIDFRGRIYPISPHVNHIGSDVVRGMMLFAKKKKLGSPGWFWLNVNLANKFGFDKVKNEERFQWGLKHKEKVLEVCSDPLQHRWWLTADSPFQALSICLELGAAYNHKDGIYEYWCALPVGQDGSCNGLQHYAAMLRDETMAKHVNVANNDLYGLGRGDVYSAVQQCVGKLVENDLTQTTTDAKSRRLANLIHGKVTRKIVKQTVMTSVYGVTYYGAKAQIKKWLSNAIENGDLKLNDHPDVDVHSEEGRQLLMELAVYLSKYTMISIGLTNTPGYLSMLWLKNCAGLIAKHGYRVSWITPHLNLPCTQHYCDRSVVVRTTKQSVSLMTHSSDNKKDINVLKQSSAYPPNFVHSLDSTHCLLTARACYMKHGLVFASIHDSFWTHACDVDIMSEVLRNEFIKLHSGSLLSKLYESFCILYPDITFAPPPNQSTFDLQQVKDSEFFFA